MGVFSLYTRADKLVIAYIISINLLAFIFYLIDKLKARNGSWRIPELNLIILGLLGGSIGGLMAMVSFHHKLSKKKFYLGLPFLVLVNFISLIYIYPRIKGFF